MCVKCGISSCGSCNGKSSTVLSGDVVYDGLAIVCDETDVSIAPGETLNEILAKHTPALCEAVAHARIPVTTNFLYFEETTVQAPLYELPPQAGGDVAIGPGYLFPLDELGEYEVIAEVHYEIVGQAGQTNVEALFYLGTAATTTIVSNQYTINMVEPSEVVSQKGILTLRKQYTKAGATAFQMDIASFGLKTGSVGKLLITIVTLRIIKWS